MLFHKLSPLFLLLGLTAGQQEEEPVLYCPAPPPEYWSAQAGTETTATVIIELPPVVVTSVVPVETITNGGDVAPGKTTTLENGSTVVIPSSAEASSATSASTVPSSSVVTTSQGSDTPISSVPAQSSGATTTPTTSSAATSTIAPANGGNAALVPNLVRNGDFETDGFWVQVGGLPGVTWTILASDSWMEFHTGAHFLETAIPAEALVSGGLARRDEDSPGTLISSIRQDVSELPLNTGEPIVCSGYFNYPTDDIQNTTKLAIRITIGDTICAEVTGAAAPGAGWRRFASAEPITLADNSDAPSELRLDVFIVGSNKRQEQAVGNMIFGLDSLGVGVSDDVNAVFYADLPVDGPEPSPSVSTTAIGSTTSSERSTTSSERSTTSSERSSTSSEPEPPSSASPAAVSSSSAVLTSTKATSEPLTTSSVGEQVSSSTIEPTTTTSELLSSTEPQVTSSAVISSSDSVTSSSSDLPSSTVDTTTSSSVPPSPTCTPNLVIDGGFEEGLASWYFSDSGNYPEPTPVPAYDEITSPQSGSRFLSVETDLKIPTAYWSFVQTMDLPDGWSDSTFVCTAFLNFPTDGNRDRTLMGAQVIIGPAYSNGPHKRRSDDQVCAYSDNIPVGPGWQAVAPQVTIPWDPSEKPNTNTVSIQVFVWLINPNTTRDFVFGLDSVKVAIGNSTDELDSVCVDSLVIPDPPATTTSAASVPASTTFSTVTTSTSTAPEPTCHADEVVNPGFDNGLDSWTFSNGGNEINGEPATTWQINPGDGFPYLEIDVNQQYTDSMILKGSQAFETTGDSAICRGQFNIPRSSLRDQAASISVQMYAGTTLCASRGPMLYTDGWQNITSLGWVTVNPNKQYIRVIVTQEYDTQTPPGNSSWAIGLDNLEFAFGDTEEFEMCPSTGLRPPSNPGSSESSTTSSVTTTSSTSTTTSSSSIQSSPTCVSNILSNPGFENDLDSWSLVVAETRSISPTQPYFSAQATSPPRGVSPQPYEGNELFEFDFNRLARTTSVTQAFRLSQYPTYNGTQATCSGEIYFSNDAESESFAFEVRMSIGGQLCATSNTGLSTQGGWTSLVSQGEVTVTANAEVVIVLNWQDPSDPPSYGLSDYFGYALDALKVQMCTGSGGQSSGPV